MRNWAFLVIISLIVACEKRDLEIPETTPVFKAEIIIDSIPYSFSGGVDDFYMFTKIIEDETLNIHRSVFSKLRADEQNESGFGIDFLATNSEKLIESIQQKLLTFHKNIEVGGILNRLSVISNSDIDFNAAWQINDQQHETNMPVEIIQTTEDTLQLNYFLNNGGLVHFDQILRPKIRGEYSIWLELARSDSGILAEIKSDSPHFNVIWSDGTIGVKRNIQTNRQYNARISSITTGSINLVINIPDYLSSTINSFGFSNERSSLSPQIDDHVPVDIFFRDISGISYRSQSIAQETSAKIQIDEVTPYKYNDEGLQTYIIKGNCEAKLKSIDGQIINLDKAEFQMAVPFLLN